MGSYGIGVSRLVGALIEANFQNNESYKKIVNSSAFCSDKNEIVNDNYKISNNEKVGIIPPIGGG